MVFDQTHYKKAALFYLYGRLNAGDAAIGLGALSFLKRSRFVVTAFSRWPDSFPEYEADKRYYMSHFNDIVIEGGPFRFRRQKNFIMLLWSYFSSCFGLLFGCHARAMKEIIRQSDLVVLNGGNLMRCQSMTDLLRLAAYLYPLRLARRYGIPYIILPQSTTGINWFGEKLIAPILSDARAVWAREKDSQKKFSSIFKDKDFLYGPDMAFHMKNTNGNSIVKGANANQINVAMTVRGHKIADIGELGTHKRDEIKKTLLYVIKKIASRHQMSLTLVVQSENDDSITNEIRHSIKEEYLPKLKGCDIFNSRDVYDLFAFYSHADLLVGMRLHSLILALISGTACVGYFDRSWGLKNPGLLKEFGLPICFIGQNPDQFVEDILDIIDNRLKWRKRILDIINEQNSVFMSDFAKVTETLDNQNNRG